MANKRMFSKQITTSDAFVEMPVSSQLLYFHLNMEADDDGFVSNPKRIMRMLNVNEDDLKILLAKRFLLAFESGVVVIKHWLLHNAVRKDMYKETQYRDEKKTLQIKENGAYTELRNDSVTLPIHRLDKVRLDKNSIELPLWLNKKSWEEWIQYRKELKKKMTDITIKKQLKLLSEHIKDHTKIIENSIANGWTGLFPLNDNFNRYGTGDAQRVLKKQKEDREAREERETSAGDSEARKKLNEDIKKLAKDKTL